MVSCGLALGLGVLWRTDCPLSNCHLPFPSASPLVMRIMRPKSLSVSTTWPQELSCRELIEGGVALRRPGAVSCK